MYPHLILTKDDKKKLSSNISLLSLHYMKGNIRVRLPWCLGQQYVMSTQWVAKTGLAAHQKPGYLKSRSQHKQVGDKRMVSIFDYRWQR